MRTDAAQGAPSASPDRFDPAGWAAVQDGSARGPGGFLFRRGRALARAAVLARAAREPRARWLDLGCGPGHLLGDVAAHVPMLGADHDPAMLHFARQVVLRGLPGELFAADGRRLPLADGSLDGVAAISLLGCVADPPGVLREVARVLRPGGVLLLTVTSASSVLRRMELAAARLVRRPAVGDVRPIRRYAVGEATHLLHEAGFAIEDTRGYGFHLEVRAHALPGEKLSRALEAVWPRRLGARIARNVFLVARRR